MIQDNVTGLDPITVLWDFGPVFFMTTLSGWTTFPATPLKTDVPTDSLTLCSALQLASKVSWKWGLYFSWVIYFFSDATFSFGLKTEAHQKRIYPIALNEKKKKTKFQLMMLRMHVRFVKKKTFTSQKNIKKCQKFVFLFFSVPWGQVSRESLLFTLNPIVSLKCSLVERFYSSWGLGPLKVKLKRLQVKKIFPVRHPWHTCHVNLRELWLTCTFLLKFLLFN